MSNLLELIATDELTPRSVKIAWTPDELEIIKKPSVSSVKTDRYSEEDRGKGKMLSIGRDNSLLNRSLAEVNQFNFQSFEHWDSKISLDGIATAVTNETVTVKCLLDEETGTFQNRVFPKELFKNITGLEIDYPVLVKINSKPGKISIVVLDGTGIINPGPFNLDVGLKDLIDSNLGHPIAREINL
jgi:hypothetical protein